MPASRTPSDSSDHGGFAHKIYLGLRLNVKRQRLLTPRLLPRFALASTGVQLQELRNRPLSQAVRLRGLKPHLCGKFWMELASQAVRLRGLKQGNGYSLCRRPTSQAVRLRGLKLQRLCQGASPLTVAGRAPAWIETPMARGAPLRRVCRRPCACVD